MNRYGRQLLALLGAIGLLAGAAACGDDDDSDSTGDTSAPSGTNLAMTDEDPIRIGNITTLSGTSGMDTPEAADAIRAGVEAINAAGGLNGRSLELHQCDDKGDPNKAVTCARDLVQAGIVATVGDASGFRDSYIPVLEEAGVPVLGNFPATPADYTSPMSYPVVGGIPALYAGIGLQLVDEGGAEKISSVDLDFPAVSALTDIVDERLQQARDRRVEQETLVPFGTADLQGAVAASTRDGIDGVALLLLVDDNVRYIQQARTSGYDGDIAVADLSQEAIDQLGDQAEGVMITAFFEPLSAGGPLIERYVDEIEAHAPDTALEKLGAINAWVALQVFVEAMESHDGDVTPEAVVERLESIEDLDLGGFIPPLTMTSTFDHPDYPRLFNRSVWFQHVEDGRIVLTRPDPIHPFEE